MKTNNSRKCANCGTDLPDRFQRPSTYCPGRDCIVDRARKRKREQRKRDRDRERVAAERARHYPKRGYPPLRPTASARALVRVEREEYLAPHLLPAVGVNKYIASYGTIGSTKMPAAYLKEADDHERSLAAHRTAKPIEITIHRVSEVIDNRSDNFPERFEELERVTA